MNGQISITLVINYEYDEREELDEQDLAIKAAWFLNPNFGTIDDGMQITSVEAFHDDTSILNY